MKPTPANNNNNNTLAATVNSRCKGGAPKVQEAISAGRPPLSRLSRAHAHAQKYKQRLAWQDQTFVCSSLFNAAQRYVVSQFHFIRSTAMQALRVASSIKLGFQCIYIYVTLQICKGWLKRYLNLERKILKNLNKHILVEKEKHFKQNRTILLRNIKLKPQTQIRDLVRPQRSQADVTRSPILQRISIAIRCPLVLSCASPIPLCKRR